MIMIGTRGRLRIGESEPKSLIRKCHERCVSCSIKNMPLTWPGSLRPLRGLAPMPRFAPSNDVNRSMWIFAWFLTADDSLTPAAFTQAAFSFSLHLHVCLNHAGCPGAGPDTPPPLSGAKMFARSRPLYKPIWRGWLAPQAPKFLVPVLKGLGEPVTHVIILKMLSFFSAFSLGSKQGRICAATADFVPTSIFPPPWGQTGTNVVCCSLKIPLSKLSPSTSGWCFGPSPPAPPIQGAKMLRGVSGSRTAPGHPPWLEPKSNTAVKMTFAWVTSRESWPTQESALLINPVPLPFAKNATCCRTHALGLTPPSWLVGLASGGGGGSIEPPKTWGGGGSEKGSIDRHH